MATRIQARWRGYASRTYIHDFSKRRRYIQEILRINEATRAVLKKAETESLMQQKELSEIAKAQALNARLEHMHHLLSTASMTGTLANVPTQKLDAALNGQSLESAVKATFTRCPPKASATAPPSVFRVEETIRVAGPYDHLREERQLARRVEAKFMTMRGAKPFIPICKSTNAWTPLPTFAQTSSRHSLENAFSDTV